MLPISSLIVHYALQCCQWCFYLRSCLSSLGLEDSQSYQTNSNSNDRVTSFCNQMPTKTTTLILPTSVKRGNWGCRCLQSWNFSAYHTTHTLIKSSKTQLASNYPSFHHQKNVCPQIHHPTSSYFVRRIC